MFPYVPNHDSDFLTFFNNCVATTAHPVNHLQSEINTKTAHMITLNRQIQLSNPSKSIFQNITKQALVTSCAPTFFLTKTGLLAPRQHWLLFKFPAEKQRCWNLSICLFCFLWSPLIISIHFMDGLVFDKDLFTCALPMAVWGSPAQKVLAQMKKYQWRYPHSVSHLNRAFVNTGLE